VATLPPSPFHPFTAFLTLLPNWLFVPQAASSFCGAGWFGYSMRAASGVRPGPVTAAAIAPFVRKQHVNPVIAGIESGGPFPRCRLDASSEHRHCTDLTK
jgi:hypothetical protein